jgi:very-short-patch-repair endonuclease
MGKIKPTNEYFINKAVKAHGDKFDYSLVKYIGSHYKVTIKCSKGHTFNQKPMDHWRGIGCPQCANKNHGSYKKYSECELLNILNSTYLNYKFEIKDTYSNTKSIIKCICSKHGDIYKKADLFLKGFICSKCNNTRIGKIDYKYFIETSNIIHNNIYNYSKSIIKDAKTKTTIICRKHGEFKQSPNSHMQGQGCPKCRLSKGESKILNWLLTNKINHVCQYKFTNLIKYSFDFYLPKHNMCIEYDGEYHYNEYDRTGGKEGLLKVKKRDQIKNLFCLKNNITLIRIPYWDFNKIENILIEAIEI